jgi:peptidoglycan hydrolase-like protein with peptidoglycan-binding domain
MIKTRKAKIAALAVGMTLALGGAASTASAQTVAELQAMINQLMAQLAALQGGSSSSMTFTQNLTLGSTGSEVSALQQVLVSGGYLVMPAGVSMGYFGPLTQAAVAKCRQLTEFLRQLVTGVRFLELAMRLLPVLPCLVPQSLVLVFPLREQKVLLAQPFQQFLAQVRLSAKVMTRKASWV